MNIAIKEKFNSYPAPMRKKLEKLRKLVLAVAEENGLGDVEETLKWGEPSYLVKGGSAVRLDWKAKAPNQYALYFNCNTKLVESFREIYGDVFHFDGKRAIIFSESDVVPKRELAHCIKLALTYHTVKHLPLLGS